MMDNNICSLRCLPSTLQSVKMSLYPDKDVLVAISANWHGVAVGRLIGGVSVPLPPPGPL